MAARRVALTGGIATGKSVVAHVLRQHGVPVVDADQVSRDVVSPGSPGIAAIRAGFGPGVIRDDGTLDRAALGRIVFADPAARSTLEAIVHPLVRAGIDRFFAGVEGGVGVAEVPLAYETGWAAAFACVVVVACRPETQRTRLAARDGLDAAAIGQRLAAQWPIDHKVRLADAVILSEGSLADTRRQAARCATWLGTARL